MTLGLTQSCPCEVSGLMFTKPANAKTTCIANFLCVRDRETKVTRGPRLHSKNMKGHGARNDSVEDRKGKLVCASDAHGRRCWAIDGTRKDLGAGGHASATQL